MKLLGVRVDTMTKKQLYDRIILGGKKNEQLLIFTPNPEMIVRAQRDQYFQDVLNSGDINICDGVGIRLFAGKKVRRYTGVDCVYDICALAEEKGWRVYIVGSGDMSVVRRCEKELRAYYPNIRIVGVNPGPAIVEESVGGKIIAVSKDEEVEDVLLHDIIMTEPEILFVGFGHGKQEKWIFEHVKSLPSVRVAVGVGGSIDYIAKKIKRAPRWIRLCGGEWLFRLIVQPVRYKRIWDATIVFVWYNILHKIQKK